jgi:2-iminoacetate synthase ThiH
MSREEMVQLIRGAGFRPAQRTTLYDIVQEF